MVYLIVIVLAVLALYGSYRMLGKDPLTDRDFATWYIALIPELSSMTVLLETTGHSTPPDRPTVQKQMKRVRSLIAHLEDFEFDATSPGELIEVQEHLHRALDSLEQGLHSVSSPFFNEGSSRSQLVLSLCEEARHELEIIKNQSAVPPHTGEAIPNPESIA
ncbi:MAG: hypothetical protein ACP5OR_08485 [Candidatus Dormibacteria bacterium]